MYIRHIKDDEYKKMLIIKHQFIQHCITQKNKKSSFQLQFGTFNIFHNWHQCSRFFFFLQGGRDVESTQMLRLTLQHVPTAQAGGLQASSMAGSSLECHGIQKSE